MSDFKSPRGPPAHEPAPVDAAPVYTPSADANGVPGGGMPPVRFGLAAAGMNTGPVAQPPNEMIANHAQPGVPGFHVPQQEKDAGYPTDSHTQANIPRDPSSYSTPPLNPQQHQQQGSAQYFTAATQPQDGQMSQQFTGGFQPQPGQQMPYVQTPPPGGQYQTPPPGGQYQQQPGASPYSQPGASPYASPGQPGQPQVASPYVQPGVQAGAVQPVAMAAINPICAQQGHRPYQPTPVCGILWAVLCFPFGLICLFQELGKPPVCANCGGNPWCSNARGAHDDGTTATIPATTIRTTAVCPAATVRPTTAIPNAAAATANVSAAFQWTDAPSTVAVPTGATWKVNIGHRVNVFY